MPIVEIDAGERGIIEMEFPDDMDEATISQKVSSFNMTDFFKDTVDNVKDAMMPKLGDNEIRLMAEQEGLDPVYANTVAQIESSQNTDAKNPKSSAAGLYQFINSTWEEYSEPGEDRFNAEHSMRAFKRLSDSNARILQERLGREPTHAELYLAHQQGGRGAAKILSNPDRLAVDVVGAKAVKLNGGREDMTAREFASLWLDKYKKIEQRKKGDA